MHWARDRSAPLLLFLLALLAAAPAAAVVPGQSDDFETETSEGWTTGNVDPPVETTGGPEGAGDAYLEPFATGGGGPLSRLAVFNEAQWTGDYLDAGVTAIVVDALHVSGSDVYLRVTLSGPAGDVASDPALLLSSAQWESFEFSLEPDDLVLLTGEEDVAAVLADVTHVRIVHSEQLPTIGPVGGFPRAEQVAATIGIDNVTAVPEPAAAWLSTGVVLALLVLAGLRARRAQPWTAETSSR